MMSFLVPASIKSLIFCLRKGPSLPQEFSVQAHNDNIVRETRRNSHDYTSLRSRSKVRTLLWVPPILFFR